MRVCVRIRKENVFVHHKIHGRTFVFGLCVSDNAEPPTKPPPIAEEPCFKTAPVDQARQPCGKHEPTLFVDLVGALNLLEFSKVKPSSLFYIQANINGCSKRQKLKYGAPISAFLTITTFTQCINISLFQICDLFLLALMLCWLLYFTLYYLSLIGSRMSFSWIELNGLFLIQLIKLD